jgi:hypothetical protein
MRLLAAAILAATLLTLPASAHAQRRGGGMRGAGSGISAPLGGQPGIGDAQGGPSSVDVERQMRERASLGDVVHKLPDFTGAEKDSIKSLEKRYGEVFKSYGIAMRTEMDSARAAGGRPDFREMAMLRMTADSTRNAELIAARALLTTDAQRAKFDQNLVEVKEHEAKHEEEMRRRRALSGVPSTLGGGLNNGAMRP